MRRVLLTAVVVVLLDPAPAHAHQGCHSRGCYERVADRQCSQVNPRACLLMAAVRYRVRYWLLKRIAVCESGLRNDAVSPTGALGILQFVWSTWHGTPYGRHHPRWARWSALAGAWLMARNGTRDWAWSRHCWG